MGEYLLQNSRIKGEAYILEFVFDFVKNIVAITIILNMVECLVSSSEYSKYIRLFTGILIIIGVLSMISHGGKKCSNLKNITIEERDKDVLSVYKGYEKNMDKKLEKVHKNIVKDYEDSIAKELHTMGIEMKNLRIKVDRRLGDVEGVYIKIKADEGGEILDKDKIYKVISKYYVLDYDVLKVDVVS